MSVVDSSNGTAAEYHLVLCEGSSLVREDVHNLAEVLVDSESSALEGPVCMLVVHADVPVDEVDLSQLNNLDGHVQ